MLTVWWSVHEIAYWELLPTGTSIMGDIYCAQLQRLKEKLSANRPEHEKIYFQHDNARPHIAKSVRQKILQHDQELLPHPSYSPDLVPSDYNLLRRLSNHLRDQTFNKESEVKSFLDNFFSFQPKEFYAKGIHSLPKRWQQVVDDDGQYSASRDFGTVALRYRYQNLTLF